MKLIKIFFLALIFGTQLNAEIQDGKVVAGGIVIRNYSLRPVQINGYEVKGGKALHLDVYTKRAVVVNLRLYKLITGNMSESFWITSQEDLDRLFNQENSFTLSSCNGVKVLDIPLVDPQKPSIEFGGMFNIPVYFGCDLCRNELEFDIIITSKRLGFGQDIYIGERFKEAQIEGEKVIASYR